MSHSAEKVLYRKAALIFEELGFLMPQSDISDDFQMDSPGAFVPFHGPFTGCLLISLTGEILSTLSSNMLAQEKPAGRQMEEDALRELANVICGNTLPAIFGLKQVFHLDTPSIYQNVQSVPELSEYSQIARVAIPFENGQADISLYTERAGTEHPIALSE